MPRISAGNHRDRDAGCQRYGNGSEHSCQVLYAWKGPGPWMAAAVWGTAFQVIIMPGRWALEWGQSQGEVISRAMEAKVGGANLTIDGGGTGSNNN
jgi:hypothetical protein